MEDQALKLAYLPSLQQINNYLIANNIEPAEKGLDNRILFINHFLTVNRKRIKKRSRYRRKLRTLFKKDKQ